MSRQGVQILPPLEEVKKQPQGTCQFCGSPLPPKRRKWCKDSCAWEYRSRYLPRYVYWQQFAHAILRRDGYKCKECGSKGELHVHHIIPISKGGPEFEESNLITLCKPCHNAKHHKRYLEPNATSRSTTLHDFELERPSDRMRGAPSPPSTKAEPPARAVGIRLRMDSISATTG